MKQEPFFLFEELIEMGFGAARSGLLLQTSERMPLAPSPPQAAAASRRRPAAAVQSQLNSDNANCATRSPSYRDRQKSEAPGRENFAGKARLKRWSKCWNKRLGTRGPLLATPVRTSNIKPKVIRVVLCLSLQMKHR